jgi:putative nucleotidyltransferase with HDIG domain/PAS domain S-box-containing protein
MKISPGWRTTSLRKYRNAPAISGLNPGNLKKSAVPENSNLGREVDLEKDVDIMSCEASSPAMNADAPARRSETEAAPGAGFLPQGTPLLNKLMHDISQSLQALQAAVREADLQAEADLAAARASEAESGLYRDFFELAPDAYLVTDSQMVIQESNQMTATMLHMDRDSLINMPLDHLIAEPDRPAFQASQVWTGEKKRDWELRLQTGEGPPFSVFVNVGAQTDQDNEPVRLLWLLRDARERQGEEEPLKSLLSRLKNSLYGLAEAFAQAVEMKDPQTAGHQRRVAQLAVAIAREMDFSLNRLEGIKVAALLHDIGKIAVPTEILSKPGMISNLESELLKSHCQVGFDLLKDIDFPWPVQQTILQHHERLDGSGYPAGLLAPDIIPEARILGVADVMEAMTYDRPYGPAQSLDKALDEISQQRGILYEPEVVNICLNLFREKGFKFNGDLP